MNRAMLRWVGWVTGLAVLIAIPLLPRQRESRYWGEWGWEDYPEVIDAARASMSARTRHYRIEERWLRADSRARVSETRGRLGGMLTVVASPGLLPSARTRLDSTARSELGALGLRVPAYPLLILAVTDTAQQVYYRYQRIVVLPAAPGDPCSILVETPGGVPGGRPVAATDRLLGTCAFFAAFGAPSVNTLAWLRESRAASAGYLTPPAALAGDTMQLDFEDRYDSMRRPDIRGCRAGRVDACLELVSPGPLQLNGFEWFYESDAPQAQAYPDVRVYLPDGLSQRAGRITTGLLAGLARELGPRRFESLWKSERGLFDEFERQEGKSLGRWTETYLAARVVPYAPGPGIPPLSLALTLALTATMFAVALWWARRAMS